LQVERTELVDAEHPTVQRWVVVEVQDAAHLGSEVRVPAAFPGLGALPGGPGLAQDAPSGLGGDDQPMVLAQVGGQFGQAPVRERLPQGVRVGAGDAAEELAGGRTEFSWSAAAPFWVQSGEPLVVERVDHLPHIVLAGGEHHRDLARGPTLH
jgi:hypothetical protein